MLALPLGYPMSGRPVELEALTLRGSKDHPASEADEKHLSQLVLEYLGQETTDVGKGVLKVLLHWLHTEFLPLLVAATVPQNGCTAAHAAAASAPVAGADGCKRCCRTLLWVHHHDDKLDTSGMDRDKVRGQYSKKQSFFAYLKMNYPEVSGFLSFGKPGVLLAEGPWSEVQKLLVEARKYSWWWGVEEKVLESDMVVDVDAWRLFKTFLKQKTEDLRDFWDKSGHGAIFEEHLAPVIESRSRKRLPVHRALR